MSINQKIRVAISLPGLEQENNYFVFLLKPNLFREYSNYSTPSKLFAIPDINIDFYLLCRILIKSGVMDRHYQWKFGDGHLLVWADQIGNEDSVRCFWLIYSLEESAKRKGGHIHVILGDENVLNPIDNEWRLQQPQYAKGVIHNTFLYDGNKELWRWLNTKNFIEQIGGNIYTQFDISYRYFNCCTTINAINEAMRAQLFVKKFCQLKEQNANSINIKNIQDNNIIDETPIMYGINNIVTRRKDNNGEFVYWALKTKSLGDEPWAYMSKFFMLKQEKFYLTNELVKQHATQMHPQHGIVSNWKHSSFHSR